MILASKAHVRSKFKSHEMPSVFMLFPCWAEVGSFCCEPNFPWNLITFVTVLDTRGQRRWSFMCWVFIREWSQDKHVGKGWGGRNPCSQEARLHLSLTASSGQARMLRMAASGENRPTKHASSPSPLKQSCVLQCSSPDTSWELATWKPKCRDFCWSGEAGTYWITRAS